MLLKEGNDLLIQVIQASDSICHSLRVICSNHAAPKKLLERVEQLDISLVLYNREFRKNLKPRSHLWLWIDSDEETAFAIHESYNPLRFQPSRMWLNVKSLRVLHGWSLPCGLSPCPSDFDCCQLRQRVPIGCMRSFPHIVQFY